MSEWMLWAVSILYLWAAVDLALHDKVALGITFLAYTVANISLIFVARG